MRYFQLLFIAFLMVITFDYGVNVNQTVFADDFDENRYEHDGGFDKEDSPFEEIGEVLGWGTAIVIGITGLLFPVRRSAKMILKSVPSAKTLFISLSKFLGKWHVHIGIFALVLSIIHGIAMFLSEGELELDGYIGVGATLLMIIAAVFGSVLIKNKKAKSARTNHITLIVASLLFGAFHILIS